LFFSSLRMEVGAESNSSTRCPHCERCHTCVLHAAVDAAYEERDKHCADGSQGQVIAHASLLLLYYVFHLFRCGSDFSIAQVAFLLPPCAEPARLKSRHASSIAMATTPPPSFFETNIPAVLLPRPQVAAYGQDFCSTCMLPTHTGAAVTCQGACMRSFHLDCVPGQDATDSRNSTNWMCHECASAQHVCFVCKTHSPVSTVAAPSANAATLFACSSGCGLFYHPACMEQWFEYATPFFQKKNIYGRVIHIFFLKIIGQVPSAPVAMARPP
jgi:hypothetical protein